MTAETFLEPKKTKATGGGECSRNNIQTPNGLPIEKSPYEQYLWCINNGIPFFWPKDNAPSGMEGERMVGDVPVDKE